MQFSLVRVSRIPRFIRSTFSVFQNLYTYSERNGSRQISRHDSDWLWGCLSYFFIGPNRPYPGKVWDQTQRLVNSDFEFRHWETTFSLLQIMSVSIQEEDSFEKILRIFRRECTSTSDKGGTFSSGWTYETFWSFLMQDEFVNHYLRCRNLD